MIAIAEVLPGCGSKPEESTARVVQQPVSNGTVDYYGAYNSVVQVDIGGRGCKLELERLEPDDFQPGAAGCSHL